MDGTMWIDNSIVSGWSSVAMDTTSAGGRNFNIDTWFTNNGGRTFANNTDVMLTDPFNLDNPNPIPTSSSPALTGAATPPSDGFFDQSANFVGAFGTDNWMEGWTNFNPVGYPVSVEEEGLSGIATSFDISQNYPNPFNPSTKIVYTVSEAADISLIVYNIIGQEVAQLVNGFRNVGTYEVTFEAENLPSGLYLYTYEAGSTRITKKMTLLK